MPRRYLNCSIFNFYISTCLEIYLVTGYGDTIVGKQNLNLYLKKDVKFTNIQFYL